MKYLLVLTVGLLTVFGASCGDEKSSGDNGGGDGDSAGDTGAGDTGDYDGMAACSDFLVEVFDRIRECEGTLAAILPANDAVGAVCTAYCSSIDATVSTAAYDECVRYSETVDCSDVEIEPDSGVSFIPSECSFVEDELGCVFPF